MDRDISTEVITELGKTHVQPFHFFEAHFDDEVVRATDAYQNIDWNGNTYYANGHFVGYEGIDETSDMQISTASVSLSGVDQVWISTVLSKDYIDRPLKIYLGFIGDVGYYEVEDGLYYEPGYYETGYYTEDGEYYEPGYYEDGEQVIAEPFLIFDGRMDSPVIDDDPSNSGKSTVTVKAASHWIDFDRTAGRHTNHAEQQIYSPGDKGFEFVSEINRTLLWGRK